MYMQKNVSQRVVSALNMNLKGCLGFYFDKASFHKRKIEA